MPKEYKHNRISSINSNQISIWDIVRRLPKKDPEKEKRTIANIKTTWPITEEQYIKLFNEKPFYTIKLNYLKVNRISNNSKYRLPNLFILGNLYFELFEIQ